MKPVSTSDAGPPPSTRHSLSRARILAAWSLALTIDGAQALAAATELSGPLHLAIAVGLDLVTMVIMWLLLGWHMVFLPSFISEMIPIVDLAPTWTAAVWFATRRGHVSAPTQPVLDADDEERRRPSA
jgi:hypothetical protein